jgi:hypothetical protein
LDELELRLKALELVHEDVRDIRNALLTVEYAVPIAILGFSISSGWLSNLVNIFTVGLVLYLVNRVIHDYRTGYDVRLRGIREQIVNLRSTTQIKR